MKVKNGGIYLTDLSGFVSPEFGYNHYCIFIKQKRDDLYLAFPITTSIKRLSDAGTMVNPLENKEIILLYQARAISSKRIIAEKENNGIAVSLSAQDIENVMNAYKMYLDEITTSAMQSAESHEKNMKASYENLTLVCHENMVIYQNDELDVNKFVISSSNGEVYFERKISTKQLGNYDVVICIKDKYNQRKKVTCNVSIVKTEKVIA